MRAKKTRFRLTALVLVLAVAVGALIGTAIGKYVLQADPLNATVHFSAKLAENMKLVEHQAVRQNDGSYELNGTEVTVNSYELIPGLDVEKDPYISITGKTPLAAYLYLEVTDGLGASSGITYTLESHWIKLSEQTNADSSVTTVYVYGSGGTAVTINDQTTGLGEIGILQDDVVYVSQKLNKNAANLPLSFGARMIEAANRTAQVAYEAAA